MFMQYCNETVTVGMVKGELVTLEGVPCEQLILVHAGEELGNDLFLCEHGLADFNRSDEVRL